MHKVVLYYACGWDDIERIKQHFGITCGTTINGETCQPVEIRDEDWETLKETERRGYIRIRKTIK